MATVYLARDLRHDREVALKVLHPELAGGFAVERFEREIRTAARLQHPHLLPVFDSGEAAGLLFFAMPFIHGESLRARLTREPQLPLEDALRIAGEVAEALEVAHQAGLVHRDIKPENILLSGGHALVADFGIARALGADSTRLTGTGTTVGTPAYMSPEQASGGEVDARTDVYALGCVLYEMLAGEPPFTGPTPQAVIAKRFVGPPVPIRALRPAAPEQVARVLDKALATTAVDRFPSAAAFREALVAAPSISEVRRPPSYRRGVVAAAGAVVLAAILAVAWRGGVWRASPDAADRMIAVLPFKNLGPPADAYFADGLTEELTSRLALLGGLGVISRTSADQYRESRKSLREIGRELGAGYVLEGSVRWDGTGAGSRIRVTPQLIEVATDRHVWTDRYETQLADVFQVQATIAEQVAAALDVTLRAPERAALASEPTSNFEAYTTYLQGEAVTGTDQAALHQRLALFERAAALDTGFAAAHARVAFAHLQLFETFADPTEKRLELLKASADRSLRLAPDLPEGHLVLGSYLLITEKDRGRAEVEFERAVALQPNNASAVSTLGFVHAMAGRWKEAAATLERSVALDPRSARGHSWLKEVHWYLRDYPAAHRYAERAIAVAPDDPDTWLEKAILEQTLGGDLAQSRQTLRDAVARLGVARLARSYNGVALLAAPDPAYADSARRLSIDAFAGDSLTYYWWRMMVNDQAGDSAAVRAYADSGAIGLGRFGANAPTMGAHVRSVGAMLEAFRGRREQAIQDAAAAVAAEPVSRDAYNNTQLVINQAVVHMVVGDPGGAVRHLEYLLSVPSQISVPALRTDPTWNRLRGHSGFQRLVAGKAPA